MSIILAVVHMPCKIHTSLKAPKSCSKLGNRQNLFALAHCSIHSTRQLPSEELLNLASIESGSFEGHATNFSESRASLLMYFC